jgi:uncharacterized membrane protein YadS
VIAVTGLSTVAMVFYPIVFSALGFSDMEIGILIGATIHDVAQVVGAGYAVSDVAGDTATFVKLLRVSLLPLVILALYFALPRGDGDSRVSLPGFVLLFAGLVVLNSVGVIPPVVSVILTELSRWLLVAAIAALGVRTALQDMFALGAGHISVVVSITFFLLAISVILLVAVV